MPPLGSTVDDRYKSLPWKKNITDADLLPNPRSDGEYPDYAELYGRKVGPEHIDEIQDMSRGKARYWIKWKDANLENRLILDKLGHIAGGNRELGFESTTPEFWPLDQFRFEPTDEDFRSEEYATGIREALAKLSTWNLVKPSRNLFLEKTGSLGRIPTPRHDGTEGEPINAGELANMCHRGLAAYLSRENELNPVFGCGRLAAFCEDIVYWADDVILDGTGRDMELPLVLAESLKANNDSEEVLGELRAFGQY